jgi:hypothetical protein
MQYAKYPPKNPLEDTFPLFGGASEKDEHSPGSADDSGVGMAKIIYTSMYCII